MHKLDLVVRPLKRVSERPVGQSALNKSKFHNIVDTSNAKPKRGTTP